MSTFDRVRGVLVNTLNVDIEEVMPNSSLYNDLGAESIDLLDITFRLEREFNIKINDDELFPIDIFNGSDDCIKDGKVTPAGIAKLKEAIPHGDFSKLGDNPQPSEIPTVFTVTALCKFVEQKMEQ